MKMMFLAAPDGNNDTKFIAWPKGALDLLTPSNYWHFCAKTIVRVKRDNELAKKTPLLVSQTLQDLFYLSDLNPAKKDPQPNLKEGLEGDDEADDDEVLAPAKVHYAS